MNSLENKYLDSREVAQMVDKPHNDLMKDIRRYIAQLGAGDFSHTDFFTESTYRTEQNKEMPRFLVTKKGCEFIANKLTGTKGTIFTAKYINRFHDMETVIQNNVLPDISKLPPNLQMAQQLLNQMIAQETRIERVEKFVENVKEIQTASFGDWKAEINSHIRRMVQKTGEDYKVMYARLYTALETRAKCDLQRLSDNKRKRLTEQGRTKTFIDAECTFLAVINDNARLKEIFNGIVKEHLIKYVA